MDYCFKGEVVLYNEGFWNTCLTGSAKASQ